VNKVNRRTFDYRGTILYIVYLIINQNNIPKKSSKKWKPTKKFRVNYQIRIPEVFVISDNGEKLGVMDTKIAIAKAQEKGLDLVEVSPIAEPPVCKFTDFGQFQYSKSKKQKEQKKKKIEIKGIRLSLKIGKHDLDFKRKQAEKFLKQGDKVRIELNLKGREKAHRDLATEVINKFVEEIENETIAEQELKIQGGKLSTIIKSK